MHQHMAVLQGVPAFAGLESAELEHAATSFRELVFSAGDHLVREGDRGARVLAFFVLVDGRATVSTGGRELGQCGPGDVVGEIGLLDEAPRSATVTAETDVRCLGLSSWGFRALVDEHPALAAKLAEAAAVRRSNG